MHERKGKPYVHCTCKENVRKERKMHERKGKAYVHCTYMGGYILLANRGDHRGAKRDAARVKCFGS